MTSEVSRLAGVELGGTKCVCSIGASGKGIEDQVVIPTLDPRRTIEAIVGTLAVWNHTARIDALGIGSFGPLELDRRSPHYGYIKSTAKPGWSFTEILRAVAGNLDVPTSFETDVNAAALGESRWGAGRDCETVAYVTVGTGIGVGISAGGKVQDLPHTELGHVRIIRGSQDRFASVCPFHDDCVEGLASGSAITSRFNDKKVENLTDDDEIWDDVVNYLAQLSHIIFCSFRPDRIIFGGGAMTGRRPIVDRIEQSLRISLNGYLDPPATPIVWETDLAGSAGPLGTLALASDALRRCN